MAAPSPGATGVGAGNGGTSVAIAVPSGVTAGTLVVAYVWFYFNETATTPTAACVTPPTGWTEGIGVGLAFSADFGTIWQGWYYHYATGTESGTYTFTANAVGGTAAGTGAGAATIITGGPTSGNPFVDTAKSAVGTANTESIATFTPGGDNSLLIGGLVTDGVGTISNPSGWTTLVSTVPDGIGDDGSISYVKQTTAAATGTLTWSISGSSGSGGIASLVGTIRPPATTARSVTQTAHARIQSLTSRSTTQTAHARIQASRSATQTAHAKILGPPLSAWKTAAANAATTPAKVLVIGDSVSEGMDASAKNKRWQDLLNAQIRTALGLSAGGVGYLPSWYAVASPTTWASSASPSTAGTVTQEETFGLGLRGMTLGSGGSLTWTVTGTDVEVWWTTTPSASFTVTIDGTSQGTVSTAAGSGQGNVSSYSMGTHASHTVTVTRASGSPQIEGIYVYDGDKTSGIHFYDHSHSGFETDAYIGNGVNSQTVPAIAPDLAIIEIVGLNDFSFNANTPAQVKANVQTQIGQLKALDKMPSIVLFIPWAPNYSVNGETNASGKTWQDYAEQLEELGSQVDYVLDYWQSLGEAGTSGFWNADGEHPSDSGSQTIADDLAAVLAPHTVTKTQTAHARIAKTESATQTAHARIQAEHSTTQTAHARLSKATSLTQTARAHLAKTESTTQSARAWLSKAHTATQTARAFITVPGQGVATQQARARIQADRTATQTASAHLSKTHTVTQTARAALGIAGTLSQTAHARIQATRTLVQHARARIHGSGIATADAVWTAGEPYGDWAADEPY